MSEAEQEVGKVSEAAAEEAAADVLDRAALVAWLDKLGEADDAAVLEAARQAHGLVQRAGFTWDDLLVDGTDDDDEDDDLDDALHDDPDEGDWDDADAVRPAVLSEEAAADRDRIDRLLARSNLSRDTRVELKELREDLEAGEFGARDRRYLASLEERLDRPSGGGQKGKK